jgi:hypothetical protein
MQVESDPEPLTWHMPEADGAEIRCWQQFFASSTRLLATLNSSLTEAHGLSLFEVLLLDSLAKSHVGSARMRDLADTFVMAPSRVTQQIRRLQSQGLVSRSADPGDRRGYSPPSRRGADLGSDLQWRRMPERFARTT